MVTVLNAITLSFFLIAAIILGFRAIRHEKNPALWIMILLLIEFIAFLLFLLHVNQPWLFGLAIVLEILTMAVGLRRYRHLH